MKKRIKKTLTLMPVMNEHLAKPLDSGQLIEKLKLYASRKQA